MINTKLILTEEEINEVRRDYDAGFIDEDHVKGAVRSVGTLYLFELKAIYKEKDVALPEVPIIYV